MDIDRGERMRDAVFKPIRSLEALGEQRQRGRLLWAAPDDPPCDDFTFAATDSAAMS
jgi:hypothetical protein